MSLAHSARVAQQEPPEHQYQGGNGASEESALVAFSHFNMEMV